MTEGRTHVVNVDSFLHYLACVIVQNRPLEKFSCSPFFHLDLTEPAPSNSCVELPYRPPILSLNTSSKAEGRFLLSSSIPRVCVKKWSSFAMTGVRGKKDYRMLKVGKKSAMLTAAVHVMVELRSKCLSCVNEMIP